MKLPEISGVGFWALALAIVLGVSAVVLFATSPAATASRERAATLAARQGVGAGEIEERAPVLVTVKALQVDPDRTRSVARVSGVLEAARSVTLAAEVDGTLQKVEAEEYGHVDAGDVLLRLDTTLRRTALNRAEAGLVRASAAYRLAKREMERQESLASRQVGSAAELDRATNGERAAYASLAEEKAALADARTHLAKSTIRAPFAGSVNWLDLEPGSYVRVGDKVAEILDLSSIEITVGLRDREIVSISPGDEVRVEVDVFRGESFAGKVARVGRAADNETQLYPVEVQLPNEGERLLPGMVANTVFEIGDTVGSLRIPRESTVSEYELHYVYVLEPDGDRYTARRRRVSLRAVPFRPQLIEIVDGIEAGERIAASSVEQLRDGLTVSVEE